MPLRWRLMLLIGLVLVFCLAGGSALVAVQAAGSVGTELRAALEVGAQTIHNGLSEPDAAHDPAQALRRLVATFDGNRHVRAILLDASDRPVATSNLLVPRRPAPGWFRALIGGEPGAVRIVVPPAYSAGNAIVLQADPTNEIGEVWAQSRDSVLILAAFALSIALLTGIVVGRAMRPLDELSAAFVRIGKGDYHGSVPERGPPELTRLATGFNAMTQRLAAAAAQNSRLNERLLSLQAEERADLARDLHDEIGPLLFAVDMTAATIERLADAGHASDIAMHVQLIHDSVGRMQRHVRTILARLRPIRAMGLRAAIERLVAFWQSRRPDIGFIMNIPVEEEQIDDDMKETIYRVVQEGMSNAIRHGNPSRVEITITHDGRDGITITVMDDGVGMVVDGAADSPVDRNVAGRRPQFGLIGMRERVMAMAGSLTIQNGLHSRGLTLTAWLPCAFESQHLDTPA